GLARAQELRGMGGLGDALLEPGEGRVGRARQALDQVAPRRLDLAPWAEVDAEGERGGLLLALEQVVGGVLRGLAGAERGDAGVGLPPGRVVALDAQQAAPDRAREAEVVAYERRVRGGVLHVAARAAVGVGGDEDRAEGAVAAHVDLDALGVLRAAREQQP